MFEQMKKEYTRLLTSSATRLCGRKQQTLLLRDRKLKVKLEEERGGFENTGY